MNAELATPQSAVATVDDRNPWIGLASFTEETREYFYGRDDEVAELARRVQRKLLTVLFGQSGLGKTSILRAGLVPRLRGQGYCPVYVRVDYSRDAPEPAEQIKQAIARTARRSGQWTQTGVAAEGETLWEFLHHRDDVLQDEAGKTLIPLLIFDQFEEIFTVAQTDDFGRARAARFIADLADLVENRPPASLEVKLEADDSPAERFDFARSDYRVLIALREDYLAPLEGLKLHMPSVTQNRLRLAPMTGTQALAAVLRPGKELVTEEVAAAIVRFVAGGSELQNAEVEPSLLSLICRELNDTRIAQGRSEISLDLLAGSHATILSNFYERALADQPAAIRRIIEDELLTDSGFRENVAEERLKRSFANAGATPDTLATLVNRRLLRIEERLDVRRVELTHDVLCSVVKSSRDIRHEREAREATERLLAEQQERERTARRSLVRARQVAAVCIVLSIGAIAAAIFAYWSTQRAKRAEDLAQQSRGQAEQLLGYLTEDFARDLERSGRLDLIANLAQREIDYFRTLPADLKGPATVRMGAVALMQLAMAKQRLGEPDAAKAAGIEAEKLLEDLRTHGDTSVETAAVYARALAGAYGQQDAAAIAKKQRAVDLLDELAKDPKAPLRVRETQVGAWFGLGYSLSYSPETKDRAIAAFEHAKQLATGYGAKNVENQYLAENYAAASAWLTQTLAFAGRNADARRAAADGIVIAEKLLEARPNNMSALFALGVIQANLVGIASDELKPAEAMEFGRQADTTQSTLVMLDPGNTINRNNLAVARANTSDAYWSLGRVEEAIRMAQSAAETMVLASKAGPGFMLGKLRTEGDLGRRQIEIGDLSAARKTTETLGKEVLAFQQTEPPDSLRRIWAANLHDDLGARLVLVQGDAQAALKVAKRALERTVAAKIPEGGNSFWKTGGLFIFNDLKGRAEFALGRYAESEQSARASLAARKDWQLSDNYDKADQAMQSTLMALALVAQKRSAEAGEIMKPVLEMRRHMVAINHGDQDVQVGLASALYAQALIDTKSRAALLNEAAALIDATSPAYRQTYSVREWRERIRKAMR